MTKYFYANGKPIAMRKGGAGVFHLTQDHLGGTALVTELSLALPSQRVRYYPYGMIRDTDPDGADPWTDRRFTGQREEPTSDGLYNYGARFHDARLGRFLSADTIVPGADNPQALNRYAYALNNPLRYSDPTGHCLADPGRATGALHSSLLSRGTKKRMERKTGFEPATPSLARRCSTTEPLPLSFYHYTRGAARRKRITLTLSRSPGRFAGSVLGKETADAAVLRRD